MLPNFLIIGTQKGATTWLASSLGQHADVFMVEQKEIHFFHRHFDKGVAWYESHFDAWAGQKAVGEATPGYLFRPESPERIRKTLGAGVKLIASLRHPVDRAYSAFWMFKSRGLIPADAEFHTCFREGSHDLRARGLYFAQVSRYLDCFSRENMLILIYEELKRDAQHALNTCLDFLEVDPQVAPATGTVKANKAVGMSLFHQPLWGLRRKLRSLPRGIERPLAALGRRAFERIPQRNNYQPLEKGLRQELFEEFIPDIHSLENLLGRDLSIWSGST